jgi:hypothetical protein
MSVLVEIIGKGEGKKAQGLSSTIRMSLSARLSSFRKKG